MTDKGKRVVVIDSLDIMEGETPEEYLIRAKDYQAQIDSNMKRQREMIEEREVEKRRKLDNEEILTPVSNLTHMGSSSATPDEKDIREPNTPPNVPSFNLDDLANLPNQNLNYEGDNEEEEEEFEEEEDEEEEYEEEEEESLGVSDAEEDDENDGDYIGPINDEPEWEWDEATQLIHAQDWYHGVHVQEPMREIPVHISEDEGNKGIPEVPPHLEVIEVVYVSKNEANNTVEYHFRELKVIDIPESEDDAEIASEEIVDAHPIAVEQDDDHDAVMEDEDDPIEEPMTPEQVSEAEQQIDYYTDLESFIEPEPDPEPEPEIVVIPSDVSHDDRDDPDFDPSTYVEHRDTDGVCGH